MENNTRQPVINDNRQKMGYSIRDTFGLDLGYEMDHIKKTPKLDAAGNPIIKDRSVVGYTIPGEFTPKIDPSYVFPTEETRVYLMGMDLKDNILLVGPTGTGKTTLCEQVAARLNYNFVRLNFDGCITRQDLVGEYVLKGKETVFQYGILAKAFRMPGTIILLDEWDTISGECAFVLQRPLERNDRQLLIMETGGELIPMHPDNVLVASANTAGQGDDSGLYSQGTKYQNYAQLNRFSMTIKLNYLPAEKEKEMLCKRYPQFQAKDLSFFVDVIQNVRKAYIEGQLNGPLSTRDLINWIDKFAKMGDPQLAAKYCFLNRATPEDSTTVEGIISRLMTKPATAASK